MASSGYYNIALNIDGMSFDRGEGSGTPITRSADHANKYQVTLPVAKALSAWVKTDADTAAGNLTAGHGWSSGQYDVYWTSGGVTLCRYDVPCVITTNAVALDGGSGVDFPESDDLTVRLALHTQINTQIDGDAIALGGIKLEFTAASTEAGHCHFEDADADVIADVLLKANETQAYDITGGDVNPFTGDPIAVCYASQSSTTLTCELKIATIEDSTP